MTTNREMLEAAAKACGIEAQWDCSERGMMVLSSNGCDTDSWNPLTSSADCTEMCVKLDINTFFYQYLPKVECSAEDAGNEQVIRHIQSHDKTGAGKEAAWRYAATMVAAKIVSPK